jgi:glycerate 2-kinase
VKGMAHKELRGELLLLAQKVLEELSPHRLIPRFLQRHGDTLFVGGQSYELSRFRRIVAVGFGKAAGTMAEALEEILGDFLEKGLVITTPGQKFSLGRIEVREGGHPVPDERTLLASRELLDLIGDLGPDDLLFVLVSGGGSALFEVPAKGLSIEDLQEVNELLLKSGATIGK